MRAIAILAAAAATALGVTALAQTDASEPGATGAERAAIDGEWAFETVEYDVGCKLSGTMRVTEPQGDIYWCEFTAEEVCPYLGDTPYLAKQRCVITRTGDQITILSELLEVKPDTGAYLPDNFALTVIDESLMEGELRSADIAPITFYRRGGLTS